MKLKLHLIVVLLFGLAINFFGQSPAPGPSPTLISPEVNAELDNGCENKTNPVEWSFTWSKVPGARRYHLYVIGGTAKFPVLDIPNITETSFKSVRPGNYIADANRRNWRWKVRALIGTTWSEWSEERIFNVEPVNTDCE